MTLSISPPSVFAPCKTHVAYIHVGIPRQGGGNLTWLSSAIQSVPQRPYSQDFQ